MTIPIVTTRESLRETLGGSRPGFVPTMGALHQGHLALIARSTAENPFTVVSIFVNPAQFTNPDDLNRYPRDFDRDVELAAEAGTNLVFAPAVEEMYPPGFATSVSVGSLADSWEGKSRPGHFRGVATVVTILLNLVQPARSYFGEKDFQQLQVIRRLHRDLALPGEIVASPTVRDGDGLPFSSRNARLTNADRTRAAAIPGAIDAVVSAVNGGETDSQRLSEIAQRILTKAEIDVDYVAVVDELTLDPIPRLVPGSRLLLAVEIGGIRLIDNVALML